jgi:YesN/AraC family two-component response regulator
MQVQIRDVLERVCGSIQEDRRSESNTIGQLVIAYVTAHYSDENLNISTIGEAFGLTPSYLSKQFKTQTGEALLEFINKTRLEHAKRLLADPTQTLSVSEIARQVGYADINTFNRIFKKYEGITPSKFKEMS